MYVTHKSYGIKTNFTLSYTVVIRCKRQKIVCQKIEIKKQIYQFKNSSNFTFLGGVDWILDRGIIMENMVIDVVM